MKYYSLTKPGLVLGNVLLVIAGFALASRGHVIFPLLAAAAIGMTLIMASASVFNNVIDRDIDLSMERTRTRELVTGSVSPKAALAFGTLLGGLGFLTLGLYTNILAAETAFIGFFFYVVMYSLWSKRRTVYGTLIGSISGAVPPVVGYCAASGRFDTAAALLFFILVLWQMPHFFAIAIYRLDDYTAARVPVLPRERGIFVTKVTIFSYVAAFTIAALALTFFGYTGTVYLAVMGIICIAWVVMSIKGFWNRPEAEKPWARKMFFLSLVIITTFSVMLVTNNAFAVLK